MASVVCRQSRLKKQQCVCVWARIVCGHRCGGYWCTPAFLCVCLCLMVCSVPLVSVCCAPFFVVQKRPAIPRFFILKGVELIFSPVFFCSFFPPSPTFLDLKNRRIQFHGGKTDKHLALLECREFVFPAVEFAQLENTLFDFFEL